jgi:hypothetical protein
MKIAFNHSTKRTFIIVDYDLTYAPIWFIYQLKLKWIANARLHYFLLVLD